MKVELRGKYAKLVYRARIFTALADKISRARRSFYRARRLPS